MDAASKITIKKGSINITMNRSDLVEVKETHDGVCFNFMGGLHLYMTDSLMPLETKNLMRQGADNFPKAHLTFNLNDYRKPCIAEPIATEE